MSANLLQANDSSWWRRIASADFGKTPTLSEVYAFGLGDNPALDNLFPMPEGRWMFPGHFQVTDTATGYGIGYIDDTTNNFGGLSPWNYVRLYGHSSASFNTTGTFNAYSLNDPTWNGSPGSLGSAPGWVIDLATFGNAQAGDNTRDADQVFAKRYYQYAPTGWTYPNAAGSALAMLEITELFSNEEDLLRPATTTDGQGQTLNQVATSEHGIAPGWTASLTFNHPDQAGDGSGFFVSYGQTIGFQHPHVKGGFTVTTLADQSDPTLDSWVSSVWAYLHGLGDTITEVGRFYADVGEKILIGGLQLPSVNSGTFAVSDATTARLAWDDTIGSLMLSEDGNPYARLGLEVFTSAEIDLLALSTGNAVVPARAGKSFVPVKLQFQQTATVGTATAAPTINIGNNVTHNNYFSGAIFPTTTVFNLGAPAFAGTNANSAANTAGVAVVLDVAVAATGATTWKGKYAILGYWA